MKMPLHKKVLIKISVRMLLYKFLNASISSVNLPEYLWFFFCWIGIWILPVICYLSQNSQFLIYLNEMLLKFNHLFLKKKWHVYFKSERVICNTSCHYLEYKCVYLPYSSFSNCVKPKVAFIVDFGFLNAAFLVSLM